MDPEDVVIMSHIETTYKFFFQMSVNLGDLKQLVTTLS